MTIRDGFEIASYAVTVVGLPFAIAVFIWERRKERETEQEEIYQRLSDEYTNFMKLVLDNADLRLLRPPGQPLALTPEQAERRLALFSILVALFERRIYWSTRNACRRRSGVCGFLGRITCGSGVRAENSAMPCLKCCVARTSSFPAISPGYPPRRNGPVRTCRRTTREGAAYRTSRIGRVRDFFVPRPHLGERALRKTTGVPWGTPMRRERIGFR